MGRTDSGRRHLGDHQHLSERRGNGRKMLWTVLVLLLPVVGLVLWFLLGPRGGKA